MPADDLRRAALLYGNARRPAIVYGLGITEHLHGTDGVRTLSNLAILTGHVGVPGGGGVNPLRGQNNVQGASDMGSLPDLYPGYQRVADETVRAKFEAAWGVQLPARPGMRIPDMFQAALAGRLKALYVFGEDIMTTDPDSGHVRAAVEACELVISQEIFLSRTAELADVVLPGASYLAKEELLQLRPAVPAGAARAGPTRTGADRLRRDPVGGRRARPRPRPPNPRRRDAGMCRVGPAVRRDQP